MLMSVLQRPTAVMATLIVWILRDRMSARAKMDFMEMENSAPVTTLFVLIFAGA